MKGRADDVIFRLSQKMKTSLQIKIELAQCCFRVNIFKLNMATIRRFVDNENSIHV